MAGTVSFSAILGTAIFIIFQLLLLSPSPTCPTLPSWFLFCLLGSKSDLHLNSVNLYYVFLLWNWPFHGKALSPFQSSLAQSGLSRDQLTASDGWRSSGPTEKERTTKGCIHLPRTCFFISLAESSHVCKKKKRHSPAAPEHMDNSALEAAPWPPWENASYISPGSLGTNLKSIVVSQQRKRTRGWFESMLQYVLAEYLESLCT